MRNLQLYLSLNNTLAKLQKHFDWGLLSQRKGTKCTVGSKIIQAIEIIRVKKLIPNVVLRYKYSLSHNYF